MKKFQMQSVLHLIHNKRSLEPFCGIFRCAEIPNVLIPEHETRSLTILCWAQWRTKRNHSDALSVTTSVTWKETANGWTIWTPAGSVVHIIMYATAKLRTNQNDSIVLGKVKQTTQITSMESMNSDLQRRITKHAWFFSYFRMILSEPNWVILERFPLVLVPGKPYRGLSDLGH